VSPHEIRKGRARGEHGENGTDGSGHGSFGG
jgi:hypothetical protein